MHLEWPQDTGDILQQRKRCSELSKISLYLLRMSPVRATLEYLQKLPLYEHEKPYWCFLPPKEGYDPDQQRVDNLEFEDHTDIIIHNIRNSKTEPRIGECGFEVFDHQSKFSAFPKAEDVMQNREETEALLKEKLGAEFVQCYDSRLRENILFQRRQLDLNDLTLTEGPARGVHNGMFLRSQPGNLISDFSPDITYVSGPQVINRYLSNEIKAKYLRPGYRFRIIK